MRDGREGIFSDDYYYGGGKYLNETLSSGTLEYVVIAEGGHEVAVGSEINGLTLYAVNSTTTINNIHVHSNRFDGVQFFGGDAAMTNLWLSCNKDDSIDWEEGYRGFLFNVSIAQANGAGYALELSNNLYNYDALPRSSGTIYNMSIDYVGTSTDPGIVPVLFRMKEGTDGTFSNVVVYSYDVQISDETNAAYAGGSNHWDMIGYGCTPVTEILHPGICLLQITTRAASPAPLSGPPRLVTDYG